jgi:hypothetical protein
MLQVDEHDIYDRLPEWGYAHRSVNHSAGQYARVKMEMVFMKSASTVAWRLTGQPVFPIRKKVLQKVVLRT